MRSRSIALVLGLSVLAISPAGQARKGRRINPMIALHEKGLPVFGITHPAIVAGGGGRARARRCQRTRRRRRPLLLHCRR